jgi:hypothetical protein
MPGAVLATNARDAETLVSKQRIGTSHQLPTMKNASLQVGLEPSEGTGLCSSPSQPAKKASIAGRCCYMIRGIYSF